MDTPLKQNISLGPCLRGKGWGHPLTNKFQIISIIFLHHVFEIAMCNLCSVIEKQHACKKSYLIAARCNGVLSSTVLQLIGQPIAANTCNGIISFYHTIQSRKNTGDCKNYTSIGFCLFVGWFACLCIFISSAFIKIVYNFHVRCFFHFSVFYHTLVCFAIAQKPRIRVDISCRDSTLPLHLIPRKGFMITL